MSEVTAQQAFSWIAKTKSQTVKPKSVPTKVSPKIPKSIPSKEIFVPPPYKDKSQNGDRPVVLKGYRHSAVYCFARVMAQKGIDYDLAFDIISLFSYYGFEGRMPMHALRRQVKVAYKKKSISA